MTILKKFLSRKKYLFLFMGILTLIGTLVGLYLSFKNINILKDNVYYYINNRQNLQFNYIYIHFFFLVISFIGSFFIIGLPLLCTLIFYQGLSLGFLLGIFSLTLSIKGFVYAIIFFTVTQLFYLIILYFFFIKCFNITRKTIGKIIYKTNPTNYLVSMTKSCGLLILLQTLYDFFLLLFNKPILNVFAFLLEI
ncbi:hypothetical protein EGP91_02595 [bacterium]|mgnify:FL=1|uniref:hypothetical protein n=1 Tax=Candidatus Ventrenecus sp. TaxID=3085654 RepID=UPI001D41A568|nr:hypothetical protein [bacterium]